MVVQMHIAVNFVRYSSSIPLTAILSILYPSIFAWDYRRKVYSFVDQFPLVVLRLFLSTGVFEHHICSTCLYKTGHIEIGYKCLLVTKTTLFRSVYELIENFFSFLNLNVFLRYYCCVKSYAYSCWFT